jgi:hypothetical protein
VGGEGDAGGEAALLAVLLPPDVVVRGDGAHVAAGRGGAVLRLGTCRIVLSGRVSRAAVEVQCPG